MRARKPQALSDLDAKMAACDGRRLSDRARRLTGSSRRAAGSLLIEIGPGRPGTSRRSRRSTAADLLLGSTKVMRDDVESLKEGTFRIACRDHAASSRA